MTDANLYITPGGAAHVYTYSINSSGATWDGITYWSSTGSAFNSGTKAYLNTKYTGGYDANKVRGVAAHGMGHALGLDHVSGCRLMNGFTTSRCGIYRPTADEINGINNKY